MPLKLRGPFCTQIVVHTSYFDCVVKANGWMMKVANMFAMLIIWCKIQQKKLLHIKIPFRKWIQLNVYGHSVKNVWINSLTLILIFWWIELAILRSHRKVYQSFILNFEDIWKRKFVFYETLIAFFNTGKPVSSWVLVETLYSDGFYVIHP